MANKKISQLPAAAALDGTEIIPIVQGGSTVKATVASIADLGGGSGSTFVEVTEDTVLASSDDLQVVVTSLAASLTITLPSASERAGQRVTIMDSTGTVSTALASVIAGGAESIYTRGGASPVGALLCWSAFASVSLVSDGVSAWLVERTSGWYIDPREVAGLRGFWDARRGITLNGSGVAGWADLSASGLNLTAATVANQPTYRSSMIRGLPGVLFDGVDDVLDVSAGFNSSGGGLSTLCLVTRDWAETVPSAGGNDQSIWSVFGNEQGLWMFIEASFHDWLLGDCVLAADGYTRSAARVVTPRQRNLGSASALVGGRISSSRAESWFNGTRSAYTRVATTGTAVTVVDAGFSVGYGYLVGAVHTVLVYDTDVSDSDWGLLNEAVAAVWGL